MAKIHSIDDLLKTAKGFTTHKKLKKMVTFDQEYPVLRSTSRGVLENAEQEEISAIQDLEVSIGYFLFDDSGLLDHNAISRVNKVGFTVTKLNSEYAPFTHSLNTGPFSVMFAP